MSAIAMLTAEERRRVLGGAERYIAANRSDPFCAARVACHIRNGISGYHWVQNDKQASHYDAQMRPVTDKDGTVRVEYHSLKRP